MFKSFVLKKIRRYQEKGGGEKTFSVDCNFIPSCSEYSVQSIERHGLCKGMLLSIKRIARCTERDLVEKKQDAAPMQDCTCTDILFNRYRK